MNAAAAIAEPLLQLTFASDLATRLSDFATNRHE